MIIRIVLVILSLFTIYHALLFDILCYDTIYFNEEIEGVVDARLSIAHYQGDYVFIWSNSSWEATEFSHILQIAYRNDSSSTEWFSHIINISDSNASWPEPVWLDSKNDEELFFATVNMGLNYFTSFDLYAHFTNESRPFVNWYPYDGEILNFDDGTVNNQNWYWSDVYLMYIQDIPFAIGLHRYPTGFHLVSSWIRWNITSNLLYYEEDLTRPSPYITTLRFKTSFHAIDYKGTPVVTFVNLTYSQKVLFRNNFGWNEYGEIPIPQVHFNTQGDPCTLTVFSNRLMLICWRNQPLYKFYITTHSGNPNDQWVSHEPFDGVNYTGLHIGRRFEVFCIAGLPHLFMGITNIGLRVYYPTVLDSSPPNEFDVYRNWTYEDIDPSNGIRHPVFGSYSGYDIGIIYPLETNRTNVHKIKFCNITLPIEIGNVCSSCNNSLLELNEECEYSLDNTSLCLPNCTILRYCGDNITQNNEECDPPDGFLCTINCTTLHFCGDNITEFDEECDPPDGFICSINCTILHFCGDMVIEFDEECDPPDGVLCSSNCSILAYCGNNIIDLDEQCDPPTLWCTYDCRWSINILLLLFAIFSLFFCCFCWYCLIFFCYCDKENERRRSKKLI